MGPKELQLLRSFTLSAKISDENQFDRAGQYTEDQRTDLAVQTSLSYALLHSFTTRYRELSFYTVSVPLPDGEEQDYQFIVHTPDSDKASIIRQKSIDDTMDAFMRRLMKEGGDCDLLRAQRDYTDQHLTLHYQPNHLIETLHNYAHKVLKGNETVLGHLYMASHMMERQRSHNFKLALN